MFISRAFTVVRFSDGRSARERASRRRFFPTFSSLSQRRRLIALVPRRFILPKCPSVNDAPRVVSLPLSHYSMTSLTPRLSHPEPILSLLLPTTITVDTTLTPFNHLVQLGTAFGLAITTIVYNRVLAHSSATAGVALDAGGLNAPRGAQLAAYHAAQWTSCGFAVLGALSCRLVV